MSIPGRAARRPLLRPRFSLRGRSWPTYGVCVCGGVLLGAGSIAALAAWRGVSPLLALALAAAGIGAALGLAFGTKALTGGERFTFYHYQLAVLAAAGGVAWLAGLPVLSSLDLLAVGLAVTQGLGRLGCLAAGCCHGRAARYGVRYGEPHAADGFPRELVGVPLLPVPALESLATAGLAAVGAAAVLGARPAGGALAIYLAGYAAVRFLLERLRGDRRPHRGGLSEAQWTALATLAAVVALGGAGRLPLGTAGIGVGGAVLVALVVLGLADRRRRAGGLLDGAHATEIAALLAHLGQADAGRGGAQVATSSRGLRLSTERIAGEAGPVHLMTFSKAGGPLDEGTAAAVARQLLRLGPGSPSGKLVAGGEPGLWHLLARAPEPVETEISRQPVARQRRARLGPALPPEAAR